MRALDQMSTTIIESALDCIITMDATGAVVDFNPAAERTFGYRREEARGRLLADLIIPEALRPAHARGLARYLETGKASVLGRRLELTALRADGSELPVELTITLAEVDGTPLFVGYLRDLSASRAAEAALREAETRFRTLVEQLPAVTYICEYDEIGTIRYISPQVETLFGYPRENWLQDPEYFHRFVHPDDREAVRAGIRDGVRTGEPFDMEYRAITADGRVLRVWDKEVIVRDEHGAPLHTQGVLMDVTALRDTEEALRDSEATLETAVQAASMVLWALDADGICTLSLGRGLEALGLQPSEAVGQSVFDLYRDEPDAIRDCRRGLAGESFNSIIAIGDLIFDTHITALTGEDGQVTAVIGVSTDVTERRRNEEEIAYLAFHDRLTGLPNRARLEEHLGPTIARARRSGRAVALLYVDLDHFKLVNDSLGHSAGDELLVRTAERLVRASRAGDLLARQGGDEFMLLLDDLGADAAETADAVAGRILEELEPPFSIDGTEFHVGASVGISLFPDHGQDPAELLKRADAAMYRAKAAGRGTVAMSEDETVDARSRLTMTARLRRALANDELLLHYQPIFSLAQGRPVAMEALIRWDDPDRGLVPPAEFIPLAETTGLIEQVGEWVIAAVCDQAGAWEAQGFTPEMTFNVSPRQLRRPTFAGMVAEQIASRGLDPHRFTVEITESTAMSDPKRTEAVLDELHALGLRLSIDDFGADYSSLRRLRALPVDILKLDRSFLRGVPEDREGAAIVEAVVALTRALEMDAVAEGVENAAQREFLAKAGCGFAQGFHLARPAPAEVVTRLLEGYANLPQLGEEPTVERRA